MASPFTQNAKPLCSMLLVSAIAFALHGCGESSSSVQGEQFGQPAQPAADSFNQQRLLQDITDNVLLPTYRLFAENSIEQVAALGGYCDALAVQAEDVEQWQEQAQQSWRRAMTTWQMAEMMQIGPLTENNSNLRNKIYSWPNVSSCAVDQEVVISEQEGYDIRARTASRRGLDALEYLLFNPELEHSCTAFGTAPEGWDSRSELQKQQARCRFAHIVAKDLVIQSDQLLNAWEGTSEHPGYRQTFIQAGEPGNPFTDVHRAVNDVSDAMFYIDSSTKDAKIATPLGIFANDCGLSPCPQNTESRYADHSLENIIANLRALTLLFKGGENETDIGFDDYLMDVGDAETAQTMDVTLMQALAYAQSLQETLKTLLSEEPEKVEALHSDVKAVTDQMKADFINSLALELPATSAGDND